MRLHEITDTLRFGTPIDKAKGAVILLHGRGASSDDIASLADALPADELAFFAPSATNQAWYPQRFFVPVEQNEPWLTSALELVDQLIGEIHQAGVPFNRVGLIGFSQGGCLALEYLTRQPRRYGLVAGLSSGLIGPIDRKREEIDLLKTPTLVACAERDPHIPLEFVEHSVQLLSHFGAEVTRFIFRGGAHTVYPEEIAWLEKHLLAWREAQAKTNP